MPDTVIAGRYRLEEMLGRGGMSEVWRAKDLELGRDVAIKLLAPDADTARFEREARAVASLAHPNITQLYDYGKADGRPYIVLEYVPGGTLEDRLKDRKPLPDDETFAIAAGIAAGLAQAHARGVVHRDLKPANVLFDEDGRPKLADFGIARMAAGEGTLTEAGTVLGTAAYISPEQALGEPATAASDVYSFGVIIYRLLTGRLPFESNDPMRLVMLHRDEPPPPIEQFRDDAPAGLAATTRAALAKNPADRPQNGAALLAELGVPAGGVLTTVTRAFDGDVTQVLPSAAAPVAAAPPPRRRSRAPLAAAALVVLAVAGGIVAFAVTRTSSPSPPATLPTFGSTRHHTTSAATTTTAPSTSTQATTTAQTTTAATTAPPPTTRPATTAPTTTSAPPTTTAQPPPTTTAPTTTAATTTAP